MSRPTLPPISTRVMIFGIERVAPARRLYVRGCPEHVWVRIRISGRKPKQKGRISREILRWEGEVANEHSQLPTDLNHLTVEALFVEEINVEFRQKRRNPSDGHYRPPGLSVC